MCCIVHTIVIHFVLARNNVVGYRTSMPLSVATKSTTSRDPVINPCNHSFVAYPFQKTMIKATDYPKYVVSILTIITQITPDHEIVWLCVHHETFHITSVFVGLGGITAWSIHNQRVAVCLDWFMMCICWYIVLYVIKVCSWLKVLNHVLNNILNCCLGVL